MRRFRLHSSGLIITALAVGLCVPIAGSAFLIQTFVGRNGPVSQVWDSDVVRFSIDSAGSDDLETERAIEILRQSFHIWDEVPTSSLRFEDTGLLSAQPRSGDNRNHVVFDESGRWLDAPPETGIIAVTRINSDSFTGRIEDADIIFNGRDFNFGEGSSPRFVNLMDVAAHEVGHLIGLDHTPLEGPSETRPTMNPFYDAAGPGEASTLEADDIAGVSIMYPTPAFLTSSATISGRVDDDLGDDVFGALIAAENINTGEIVSTLTGAFPDRGGRGDYFLRGLTAGSHRISIAPIRGRINERNFGGIFEEFDTSFPVEFYDNAERNIFASILVVEPGSALDGIDFTTGFAPPGFPRVSPTLIPVNTPDTAGPYVVQARVVDAAEINLALRQNLERIPMKPVADLLLANTYEAAIPGADVGTLLEYRIEATTADGLTTVYPGSGNWLNFEIIALSGAPLAFTVYREEDVIGVIDTGTERELARIPVGENPLQLLADPSGEHLFVSNLVSDEIIDIDTETFRIVRRIPVAGEPLDLAMSPGGEALYVSHTGSASLTRIDIDSGEVAVSTISGLQRGSYGIAVAGPSESVYVTDIGNNEVVVSAPPGNAGNSRTDRIPVVASPRSLAVSPDGRTLYVTSFTSGAASVIDTESNTVVDVIDLQVSGSFAVWPSRDGRAVYFTAHDDGVLVVVDAATRTVMESIPIGDNPRGIGESPKGDLLFVTSAASNQIHVLDMLTNELLTSYETGRQPRGIALIDPPKKPSATNIDRAPAPTAFALFPPYPNPFNAAILIPFSLPEPGADATRLVVYNISGQLIRILADGRIVGGAHHVNWDGKNGEGRDVASGVYLLRLETAYGDVVRKVSLLR